MSKETLAPLQMAFELPVPAQTESAFSLISSLPEVVRRSGVQSTGEITADSDTVPANDLTLSGETAYPHIYDLSAGDSGAAMNLIAQAKVEANAAIDAWSDADLSSVSGKLAQIATTLAAAHNHTQFNESWGAVVSYIRRAVLIAGADDVNMQSLMQLSQSLRALYEQPMLALDGASELIEKLEEAGWNGRHESVAAFVEVLIGAAEKPTELAAVQHHLTTD